MSLVPEGFKAQILQFNPQNRPQITASLFQVCVTEEMKVVCLKKGRVCACRHLQYQKHQKTQQIWRFRGYKKTRQRIATVKA